MKRHYEFQSLTPSAVFDFSCKIPDPGQGKKKAKTIFQKATPCSFILYNSIYAIRCTTKIKLSLSYPRPLIEHQNQMIPIDLDYLLLQMKPHEPQQLSIEGLAHWPLPALSLVHQLDQLSRKTQNTCIRSLSSKLKPIGALYAPHLHPYW